MGKCSLVSSRTFMMTLFNSKDWSVIYLWLIYIAYFVFWVKSYISMSTSRHIFSICQLFYIPIWIGNVHSFFTTANALLMSNTVCILLQNLALLCFLHWNGIFHSFALDIVAALHCQIMSTEMNIITAGKNIHFVSSNESKSSSSPQKRNWVTI